MKKNLAPRLMLLFALALSLQSCRTGEDYLSAKEEQYYSNKFQVFTSFNDEPVDYTKGFKTLMETYDGIHKTHYTRSSAIKSGNQGKSDEEYVEFRLHSQSMLLEDDERWIIYPMVKNGQVSGLMAGILRNEETEVEFRKLDSGNDYYDEVFKIFSMAYLKHNLKNGLNNKGGGCGFSSDTPCDIDDIVISPPKSGPKGNGPKSGCTGLNNCIKPDVNPGGGEGGGGTGPNPTKSTDPCAKMKNQNTDPNFKAKVNKLESNLGLKKETGYVEKTNGNFEYKDNASATEDTNSLTLGNPTADMKGYMHTHPNDFEDSDGNMRKGFKIFSPADVIYFNQMVALAKQNGTPLEDMYAIMVSGNGNYQIRFTGNINQIKTVYANTKKQYNEMYIKYFQDNNKRSDEMNFLKFMEEHMYVKGVTLVKMEANGAPTKKTLNSTKNGVTDDPCPQ